VADQRAQAEHDARVQSGDRGRQQGVPQRPADDHVDIEQLVPQDGHGHGHRDDQQHDERLQHERHLDHGRVRVPGREGQQHRQLASQHGTDGQGQPLHLLPQSLVPGTVADHQRDDRRHQHHCEHHGQAVQRAQLGPAGQRAGRPERERVAEFQRDAARGRQRHLPRADHERGQRHPDQDQARGGRRTPAG
jgi:hypothetical protein